LIAMQRETHSMRSSLVNGQDALSDDDRVRQARQCDQDGCAELLARLLKHHPEHERPITHLGGDKGDI
jgi:hypothetical protein